MSFSHPPPTAVASSSNLKKRKFTRDQLVRNLQILGTLSAPLPPELPISPPLSRSPSPSSPNKRKQPPTSDSEKLKRPRTLPPRPLKAEPTEDGELQEDHPTPSPAESIQPPIAAAQSASSATVPVRRPRRGRGDAVRAIETKEKYHADGKILKYSGDARFWSTYPPNHRHHRPLANPPPVGSPYHKNGNLIARLELVDALVLFAYSIWSNEYFHNDCVADTWGNISEFLAWCKAKWSSEDTQGEQEKAFLGLVYMIEAYINHRKFVYACLDRRGKDGQGKEGLESASTRLYREIERQQQAAVDAIAQAAVSQKHGSGSANTPTMLPSPASASSVNSTPTMANRSPVNPAPSNQSQPANSTPSQLPNTPQPSPPHTPSQIPALFPLMLQPETITAFRNQNLAIHAAQWCSRVASQHLNVPVLMRHFPTTWARIAGSSLSADEEHEPDIEDDEGELYWPGQSQIGEGLGWVCLMGKAMIKEFGKGIGYLGIDGVIRKEDVIRGRDMRRAVASSSHNASQHGQPRGSPMPQHMRHSMPSSGHIHSHHGPSGPPYTGWNGRSPPTDMGHNR